MAHQHTKGHFVYAIRARLVTKNTDKNMS